MAQKKKRKKQLAKDPIFDKFWFPPGFHEAYIAEYKRLFGKK